ncbi:hypothetical protein N781_18000 [Pontibacillus halophilus JSM 076056 = DSM 19796]|uniref:Uncharacterized protein n=1 Tax=Pontibacillus halophilus JSM 076056 = DSM 19796 TaxID=1385510 RepID=A0A0A5GM24_9BACI|nr:hypothetical protein [Pontibacillus halophilus]KGX92288.1 hypothetical protein N781_18000 [Pontibacillus halophilus JSM 076056 = DSM 19796]
MFTTLLKASAIFGGCFLCIYWFPLARLPIHEDYYIYLLLSPWEFLFGSISFLIGALVTGRVLFHLWSMILIHGRLRKAQFVLLLSLLATILLAVLSIKIVLAYFIASWLYGLSLIETKKEKASSRIY